MTAELLGTAILVTAYSIDVQAFGMGAEMIYMMLVILLHPISGAHLNPAITLGQLVNTKTTTKEITFASMIIVLQIVGGFCGMTISMLFRGVGNNNVTPPFVDPVPLINTANLDLRKQATVVFFSSAVYTSFFVAATMIARKQEQATPLLIAFPSAVALYFANLMTQLTSGGFNNPVVALIIVL